MSKTQRNRRLRRRRLASAPRGAARRGAVAFTGSLLVAATLTAVPTSASTPSPAAARDRAPTVGLVEDATPGRAGSDVGEVFDFDGRALMSLDDGEHGDELWISDGSESGTHLVKDIDPRHTGDRYPEGSKPGGFIQLGDTVLFTADDGRHGIELWRTDGTAAGTTMVTDVPTSTRDSYGFDYNYPADFRTMGGFLYFSFDDDVHGRELWRSDGTRAGTTMVADINPGKDRFGPFASSPSNLEVVGDTIYFAADDGTTGQELWKTDGTTAGTELVADIRPGRNSYDDDPAASQPQSLTGVGDTLYFTADDDTSGRELWRSDGTAAGTVLVEDIRPGTVTAPYDDTVRRPADSYAAGLTAMGGTLYFTATDGVHGNEVWRSDGTAAGTRMVDDIDPRTRDDRYDYQPLVVLDGALYFAADDGTHGNELWRSDGTAAGTRMVDDINGDAEHPRRSSSPSRLTVVDDVLYFTADTARGRTLWTSTGDAAGTRLFADVADEPVSGHSPGPQSLDAIGSELYFTVDDGVYGTELWSTSEAARSVPRVTSRSRPEISGEIVAGGVLTASAGEWTPSSGLRHAYQWYVGRHAVKVATRPRFRPGSSDVGKRITVRVITMRDGYRGAVAYSEPTAPVVDEPLTNLARPAAEGRARVGALLTATRGRWSAKNLRFTFRWSIGGRLVAGADERTFRLPPGAAGQPVVVRVTATRPAGARTARSAPRVVAPRTRDSTRDR